MKPITTATTILLIVVAVAHALRVVFGVPVTVGTFAVPLWVSVVGALLPGGLALGLWRERVAPSRTAA
jgi:hypothetical protein